MCKWVTVSNAFFGKRYLRKYSGSEMEILHIGRVWCAVHAHPVFDLDCRKETMQCHNDGNIRNRSLDWSVICGFMDDFRE